MKKFGRENFIITDKFGMIRDAEGKFIGHSASPEYVRQACEASLKRLDTDYIDVYIPARVDPKTPIEETVYGINRHFD